MKRTFRNALALSGALALAACGGGNDDAEVIAEDSVESAADEAMEEIDAEPVVDETVVPAPRASAAEQEPELEGPSETEVARIESAGEAAAAAAADVAAIAAGAASAASTTEDDADDGESVAMEGTE